MKFFDNVLLNIEKRFPVDSTNVVNAFGILSLCNVRFQNEELETLLSHYGSAKKTQGGKDAVVDVEKCRIEWSQLYCVLIWLAVKEVLAHRIELRML